MPSYTPPVRSWAMPPLKVKRSVWGWTMYAKNDLIVASADDPGQLVNYAVELESDVHVEIDTNVVRDGET